jgi:hypothetical protein
MGHNPRSKIIPNYVPKNKMPSQVLFWRANVKENQIRLASSFEVVRKLISNGPSHSRKIQVVFEMNCNGGGGC